ncbi:MAG: DUF2125 domain-containing protein [Pseudomonadota bacterium]
MKRLMKWGLGLVVLGAIGWFAWWSLLAVGQETAISTWFEERREAGWQAEHGAIDVQGFPFRLDRRISDIALADPRTGWAWALPVVSVEGAAQTPTRIRVSLPEAHRLAVPGERVDITHETLAASLALRPEPALPLLDAKAEGRAIRLESQSGWTAEAEILGVQVTERAPETGPANAYDLLVDAQGVDLPKPIIEAIDPTGLLEPKLDALRIEGHGAFRAPLDRHALEDGRLALAAATVKTARLTWGELSVEATGSFQVDRAGFPEGKVKLRLRNWRQMIKVARDSGAVSRDVLDAIEEALEFVALLAGGGDTLDVPLRLSGGKVRIGPVAVADAPRVAPPL